MNSGISRLILAAVQLRLFFFNGVIHSIIRRTLHWPTVFQKYLTWANIVSLVPFDSPKR